MVFGICSEVYVATAGCSKEPTIELEIDASASFRRFSRTGVDLGEKAGEAGEAGEPGQACRGYAPSAQ
jgi:hypothetical protein